MLFSLLWTSGEIKMIKGLIVAVQFLSRLPLNINVDFNEENIGKSIFFYPLVGMVLGGLSYLVYYLFSFISKDVASLMTVVALIVLTGGLHLDGLSDTFDGFFSNRDREKILEIMKDSRVGAFGVISLIVLILAKYVFISNMDENIFYILVLSLGNSRLLVSHKIVYKNMARPGGLGDMLHSTRPKKYFFMSLFIYIGILILINPIYLIPLGISFVFGEIISKISYNNIGGLTGDVYGASIEIVELVSFISFIGVMNWISL